MIKTKKNHSSSLKKKRLEEKTLREKKGRVDRMILNFSKTLLIHKLPNK